MFDLIKSQIKIVYPFRPILDSDSIYIIVVIINHQQFIIRISIVIG